MDDNMPPHWAGADPKYPRPIWMACFAAQLNEVKPSAGMTAAVKAADLLFDELCALEPELAACHYAAFLRECAQAAPGQR